MVHKDHKGIDLLLKAFAAVLERHPDARLILKGSDPLYNSKDIIGGYLNALSVAERERVLSNLVYIGNHASMDDMTLLYQAADAYVSPYRAEGFNMPVLEAMACGVPVICTDGGPTDDFTTGEFALRVAARLTPALFDDTPAAQLEPDPDHLLELMLRAIEDEAWCRRARSRGPAFAHEHMNWDRIAGDLLKVGLG